MRRLTICVSLFSMILALSAARAKDPQPAPSAADHDHGYMAPDRVPVVPAAEDLIRRIKPHHPRLLIDAAGFESLRQRIAADPVLKQWDGQLRRDADKCLTAKLPEHVIPDGLRLLDTSRRMLQHTYTLAMAYRLHGERRHLDRLWQELQAVAAFPDFNPRHFLDTAEMTHALAIAYDWLYDQWSDAQRATIRKAIVEMGLKPGLKVYESRGGWHRSPHNWNQARVGVRPPLAISTWLLQSGNGCVPNARRRLAPNPSLTPTLPLVRDR